jgi:P27 family predicted phage terminase small subunit
VAAHEADVGALHGGGQPEAGNGFELLDKSGFMESTFREHHTYDRAVAGELERMGLLTEIDVAALTAYCLAWESLLEAAADVRQNGVTVPGARGVGERVKNPAFQVMRDSMMAMRAFASEFGLTPQSRARMRLPNSDVTDSEIEALFSQT